jgi:hypothetical protein
MAVGDFDRYYGVNPIEAWSQNRWSAVDPAIALEFRKKALFGPLIDWVALEQLAAGTGTSNPTEITTGREALPGHTNHNPIATRAKYVNPDYVDSRERKLRSRYRYGGKIQLESYDRLVNMWRQGGTQGFIDGILQTHLSNSIVGTTEKIARDSLLTMGNIRTYAGGATNLAGLSATSDFVLDEKMLRDTKLKLSVRSKWAFQNFGDYANPMPGSNLYLVITTPGVFHAMFDNLNSEYVQRLTALGNQSIMNLDMIVYEGFLFMQSWDAALFNMGPISKQVSILESITAGDGAPDPENDDPIDNLWYVGQASPGIKHYVQCSDFSPGDFAPGDFVSLHTSRTNSWGVTDGVDVTDGYTETFEVQTVDAVNNRLTFRTPVMTDYAQQYSHTTLGGASAAGAGFGFVTKGVHVQPAYIFGARGGLRFAMRKGVQIYNPPAIDDFQTTTRVSWDMFGEMNRWNTDLWEVHMGVGSWGNRGTVGFGG